MAELTYYYSKNQQQRYAALVRQPLFHQFVDFFLSHAGQRIILRKLKAAFPKEQQLDQFLEEMIAANLLERNNRHYQLAFPIYTKAALTIPKGAAIDLTSLKLAVNGRGNLLLGEVIWRRFFENTPAYFFGLSSAMAPDFPDYDRKKLANDALSLVSIYKKGQVPLSLPLYFDQLRQNNLSANFATLAKQIGDVNPLYFMQQAQQVIKRAQKQRGVNQKPNIFFESLRATNVVKVVDDRLRLNVPSVTKAEVQTWAATCEAELTAIFDFEKQHHFTVEEQILFRSQLFAQLMAASQHESFEYIYLINYNFIM